MGKELCKKLLSKLGDVPKFIHPCQKNLHDTGIKLAHLNKMLGQLQKFQASLNKFNQSGKKKTLTLGNVGELVVGAQTGLFLLSGTTTRGADAIAPKKVGSFPEGRYQIKYRDCDTSDITFRVDVRKRDGKWEPTCFWDYLLIATHEGENKIPTKFYVVSVKDAILNSEILYVDESLQPTRTPTIGLSYYRLRINWTMDRRGRYGNLGAKKKIFEKYKVSLNRNGQVVRFCEDARSL